LGDAPVAVSQWLVEPDGLVTVGDRLIELLADGVTVDLPAPTSGRLVEIVVVEDDEVKPGMILGWIEGEAE
jgi:pyruvate/2-oxoglutarate dehydrogenase complex dihydrolipoamide acyltransferase (E2) component